MELDGSRQEGLADLGVEIQSGLDNCRRILDQRRRYHAEVLAEDAVVDGLKCVRTRLAERQDGEMPLQTRVDGEATGGRVHAGDVLRVVDLL